MTSRVMNVEHSPFTARRGNLPTTSCLYENAMKSVLQVSLPKYNVMIIILNI